MSGLMRVLAGGLLLAGLPLEARDWVTFPECTWVENKANDGDSFHLKHHGRDYLVRLYFVDTPETDNRFPDRVKEQADYFSITSERALKGGAEAAAFTRDLLRDKTFAVYTRYADARGSSDQKRYYTMVKVGDRWLGELLVENGYARVFGQDGGELPDGVSSRRYWTRLRSLERDAKAAGKGLWGDDSPAGSPKVSGEVTLTRAVAVFDKDPPYGVRGTLPAGWKVTLGGVARPGFREVSFVSPGGTPFTGTIRELDVPATP